MNETIFHIYNRGVEKRNIFLSESDYTRFLDSLSLFNSTEYNSNITSFATLTEVRLRSRPDTQLVEIMAFCLMPNHYHIMLRPRIEPGLTIFMRKLGTGYTNYFNLKYKRVGSLFQGKFKSKAITSDTHFNWLPHYIHTNPFDRSLTSVTEYPWSSYGEYAGMRKYSDIVDTSFLSSWFETCENFKKESADWLASQKEMSDFHELVIP